MPKTLPLLAAALLTLPATVAFAQDDSAQVERQEIMEDIGDAMGVLGKMVKGQTPYDATAATSSLQVFITETPEFLDLFPAGSESGYETRAKPEIWQDMADFESKGQELVSAAEAAMAPAEQGLDAFRAAFGPIGQSCKGCHETYRAPKS